MESEKHYKFFSNQLCEYFPCHQGADPNNFNCLFCYCPLYALDAHCGGNFSYTDTGVKDCTKCLLPHSKFGYQHIIDQFPKLVEMMKRYRGDA